MVSLPRFYYEHKREAFMQRELALLKGFNALLTIVKEKERKVKQ